MRKRSEYISWKWFLVAAPLVAYSVNDLLIFDRIVNSEWEPGADMLLGIYVVERIFLGCLSGILLARRLRVFRIEHALESDEAVPRKLLVQLLAISFAAFSLFFVNPLASKIQPAINNLAVDWALIDVLPFFSVVVGYVLMKIYRTILRPGKS